MSVSIEQLRIECKRVREAGKRVYDERIFSYMCKSIFPTGWCGCLSYVLGAVLSKKYPKELFDYVSGIIYCDDGHMISHAWIEHGDLVLDITADRFEGINEEVIIVPRNSSDFHLKFCRDSVHPTVTDLSGYHEELAVIEKLKGTS